MIFNPWKKIKLERERFAKIVHDYELRLADMKKQRDIAEYKKDQIKFNADKRVKAMAGQLKKLEDQINSQQRDSPYSFNEHGGLVNKIRKFGEP